MEKLGEVRVLIVGYGNIGQAVLNHLPRYPDLELAGIVTRNPKRVSGRPEIQDPKIMVFDMSKQHWKNAGAQVAILCGGSKEDLPKQGPFFARFINTVDSFDTHGHIGPYVEEGTGQPMLGYRQMMHLSATDGHNTALICQGWDPGTFSIMRALFIACLGGAHTHAFYGLTERGGLSMGHSDALRRVPGVQDARQYTHAISVAIERVRSGENPSLTDGEKHWRQCFVVLEPGADKATVEEAIKSMPNYFAPFQTTVYFIPQEELNRKHAAMPHDGVVVAATKYGSMEFSNTWASNPEGTAGILLAAARAAVRLNKEGKTGAYTPLDVPMSYLLNMSDTEALKLV
jgi:diaminopimelate dehydrogenase